MMTPSQIKLWLDTLQFFPIVAFFLNLDKCSYFHVVANFRSHKD